MKTRIALTAAIPFLLAACGDEPTSVDPTDTEAMAELANNMVKPQAGQYEVASELIEFEVPGMPEEQAKMVRGMMEGLSLIHISEPTRPY